MQHYVRRYAMYFLCFFTLVVFFRRPWYKRAANDPSKTSISTPYMDAAGVGKIITISQALFEGITARNWSSCQEEYGKNGPFPGGCLCRDNRDCISRKIIN